MSISIKIYTEYYPQHQDTDNSNEDLNAIGEVSNGN